MFICISVYLRLNLLKKKEKEKFVCVHANIAHTAFCVHTESENQQRVLLVLLLAPKITKAKKTKAKKQKKEKEQLAPIS